jgi:hypothetical protein
MAQQPQGPLDEIPDAVLLEAKAELEAESRTGVERIARAACVVLKWGIDALISARKAKK